MPENTQPLGGRQSIKDRMYVHVKRHFVLSEYVHKRKSEPQRLTVLNWLIWHYCTCTIKKGTVVPFRAMKECRGSRKNLVTNAVT